MFSNMSATYVLFNLRLNMLKACKPSPMACSFQTLMCSSRSQNWAPEGNGVHFMVEVVSRILFTEESDGVTTF